MQWTLALAAAAAVKMRNPARLRWLNPVKMRKPAPKAGEAKPPKVPRIRPRQIPKWLKSLMKETEVLLRPEMPSKAVT